MARRKRKQKRSHSAFDDFAPDTEEVGGRNPDARRESTSGGGVYADRPVESAGCTRTRPIYELESDT